MTQEERKAAISAYQKEKNRKVLKALKWPVILIILGLGYIFIVEGFFDFKVNGLRFQGLS
jgi:cell division septal protein FtsQ